MMVVVCGSLQWVGTGVETLLWSGQVSKPCCIQSNLWKIVRWFKVPFIPYKSLEFLRLKGLPIPSEVSRLCQGYSSHRQKRELRICCGEGPRKSDCQDYQSVQLPMSENLWGTSFYDRNESLVLVTKTWINPTPRRTLKNTFDTEEKSLFTCNVYAYIRHFEVLEIWGFSGSNS